MPTGTVKPMRGTILDADSFDRGDLDTTGLENALDHWTHHRSTQSHEVAERIAGCEVVVTNKVIIAAAAMQSTSLNLIVVAATGTNNIDLVAAKQRGITVCNVRDYASAAVSQHVFSLLLALVSHLGDYTQAVKAGRWQESKVFCLLDYPIRELDGMTLGIIGYGNLGLSLIHI